MASKTQIRLAQLTGSLSDVAAPLHPSEITEKSLQGVLDHVASGIKRITGAAQYSSALAGHFSQNLHVTGSLLDLNQAAIIRTDAGALTLNGKGGLNLQEDGVSILAIADNRNVTVASAAAIDIDGSGAISIDSSAGSMTMGAALADGQTLKLGKTGAAELSLEPHGTAGNEKIALVNTAGTAADAVKIQSVAGAILLDADAAASAIKLDSEGTGAASVAIDSAGGVDITSTGAHPIDIESTNAAGHIVLKTAHTAGTALHIDANADAGSIVDLDAGILDVDVTGDSTHNAGGKADITAGAASVFSTSAGNLTAKSAATLVLTGTAVDVDSAGVLALDGLLGVSLGTATSGVAITIGHSTSEVTVADNLTVTGDFVVNGATTTVDTANLNVKDAIITLGVGGQALNSNAGILFTSGSSIAGRPDVVFGRMANDVWGLGSIANPNSGSITTVAGMTNDVAFRAKSLEIAGASNSIAIDSSNIKVVAAADVVLDPAGGEVIVDGNLVSETDSTDSLGASGTAWANLYVDAIDLNGQGSISVGGTGRIDLDADDDTSIRASADDVITFEVGAADLYEMNANGIKLADDKKVIFGTNDDSSFEYDEDGDNVLQYAGTALRIGHGAATELQFRDADLRLFSPTNGTLQVQSDNLMIMSGGLGELSFGAGLNLISHAGGLNTHFTGSSRFGIVDNNQNGLVIQEGTTTYIQIDTRNSQELIDVQKLLQVGEHIKLNQNANEIRLPDSQAAALAFKDASAATYLSINTAQNGVGVPDNVGFTYGNNGDFVISHNGTDTLADNAQGLLTVKNRGGNLILSASAANAELQFGDAYSANMAGGLIDLAKNAGEFTNFISNFSNSTSVIGALNSLASGGTRTKISYAVTGSHAANIPMFINAALNHDGGASFAATDVYVNGQLLTSGTAIADGDYKLGMHPLQPDHVQFFFGLEAGDQVQITKA